jgi:hypothetical protein
MWKMPRHLNFSCGSAWPFFGFSKNLLCDSGEGINHGTVPEQNTEKNTNEPRLISDWKRII